MDREKKAYLVMFNGCTSAIWALEVKEYDLAKRILIHSQQLAESILIEDCIDEMRAKRAAGELKEEEALVAQLMRQSSMSEQSGDDDEEDDDDEAFTVSVLS